jgi:RNA polymerase sigma-70 factor (ECF subfamily)
MTHDPVADAYRREWAAVLAATVRVTRDLELAEECVQDAYASALVDWTTNGVPDKPGAWLTTAARHNALDAMHRAATLRDKLHLLVEPATEPARDDRLRLLFLCCHPALADDAQVALTLRLVCGMSTPDIAAVFLVPGATMAARLTRAKKKILAAHIPFRMPTAAELPDRLDAVLTTIHLLHTTGHTAPTGAQLTVDTQALDLARLLHNLMPDEREVRGLLALLLANHARRMTRTDTDGHLVRLADQDRARWDQAAIREADSFVVSALRGGRPGRFALQAAIASLHASAATYADTDWRQILVLYDELRKVWPSPVVALNRAVAVAEVWGPEAALTEVERLERDKRLRGYRYVPAIKADLLSRLNRNTEAVEAYERAIALADNNTERAFLVTRQAAVRAENRMPTVP